MSRPGVRRLAGALATAGLLALVATPAPAAAGPVPAQASAEGVSITALDPTPWVTRSGDWILTHAVAGAPPGATVTADLSARVADREEYAATVLGVIEGEPLPSLPEVPLDDAELLPDGSRSVTLAVSLRQSEPSRPGWRFFSDGLRPGVYPVDVNVVDADGTSLDRIVAHITRVPSEGDPDTAGADVLVAPVVALGSGPTVDPSGQARSDPTVTQAIDDLDEGLEDAGELPLTIIPRPESVEALAREDDTQDALATLRRLARGQQVVDGSYVELPLGAWVERGLTDELSRQRVRGNSVLTEHLGRIDSSTWDARTGLTSAAAGALWPVGVRTVLLAPTALAGDPVTGPVTVQAGTDRSLEAVVPDPDISGSVVRYEDDPVLGAAALAAELALRAASTEEPQGVVLAPPEGWADPTSVALVAEVLLDPAAPVEPVTLADLLDQVPNGGSRDLAPSLQPDLGGYPDRLGLARARLSSYASLVGADTGEVGALDQLLLLSGSNDLTSPEQAAYVEEVLATTERRFRSVQAPAGQTVNLTSSDGSIPLTLLNELDRRVTVSVELRANGPIEIREFDETQELVPGTNSLRIPVHARAPGDASIDITVRTTDGEVEIDEVRYTVRSTAVPGIGVVLSVGAVAFLLVWWARHWLRARKARGGGGTGGGRSDGGGGPDGPDDDGNPDPAASSPTAAPSALVGT